jgi:hypothetical protein
MNRRAQERERPALDQVLRKATLHLAAAPSARGAAVFSSARKTAAARPREPVHPSHVTTNFTLQPPQAKGLKLATMTYAYP